MISGYDLYVRWCHDHGRVPPSREWWDRAYAMHRPNPVIEEIEREMRADQREIDHERREGWAYPEPYDKS